MRGPLPAGSGDRFAASRRRRSGGPAKRLLAFGLAALLLAPVSAGAEGPARTEDPLAGAMEPSLTILIAARVSGAGEAAVWNAESSETTIPGRGIGVRLVGSNVVVVAQFTPYIQTKDSLILVAQGQVWISTPLQEEIKYLTTLKSIPVSLGEKVLFFPLGVKRVEKKSEYMYDIELEIKILPHTGPADKVLP